MMKLAWNMVAQLQQLWVRIMCKKYGCSEQIWPTMEIKRRCTSSTWKAIVNSWKHVTPHISWTIGSGNTFQFWTDHWILGVPCLQEFRGVWVPKGVLHLTVSSYSIGNDRNWAKLLTYLPMEVCNVLASLKAPTARGPNTLRWLLNSGGDFSVKTAYAIVSDSAPNLSINSVSPRIKTFLWKLVHGRLMTNEERVKLHMGSNLNCPCCSNDLESIMHLLRDCELIMKFWEPLVDTAVWHLFASKGFHYWLEWNLDCNDIGLENILWSIFFGFAIDAIWRDRNLLVFERKSSLDSGLLHEIILQAWMIQQDS